MNRIELRRSKSLTLNRRSFLAGSGVAMSLPLLEAMLPAGKTAFAQDVSSPERMLCYFVPNGIHMQTWTPEQIGRDYALTQTLAPLAPVKEDVLVLTGLENEPGDPDGAGDHGGGTGGFLTCTAVNRSTSDLRAAVSVDQMAAQRIGHLTRLPSLQLGLEESGGVGGNCDNGFSCAYLRNISWSSPNTPLPKISDARQAFDRLFDDGNSSSNASLRQIAALNQSVIDAVKDDVNRLESKLGISDREKLQEYLSSVRQLEDQLNQLVEIDPEVCEAPNQPAANLSYQLESRAMIDIMVVAFQCDITRVISYMFANSVSGRNYSHLGINDGHHNISHHGSRQSNYDMLQKIDKYEIEEYSHLIQSLKSTKDIQGKSLLDSCMVYLSSEISDGNRHNHDNLPVILAGKCNGYFDVGRHVRYGNSPPLANLYASMLDAMKTPVSRFGDNGTGLLGNLKG